MGSRGTHLDHWVGAPVRLKHEVRISGDTVLRKGARGVVTATAYGGMWWSSGLKVLFDGEEEAHKVEPKDLEKLSAIDLLGEVSDE